MLDRAFTWGDIDGVFAAADQVFSAKFRWNRVGANPDRDLRLRLPVGPGAEPPDLPRCLPDTELHGAGARAHAASWPANQINIISHPQGGGFGGKGGPRGTDIAALLSRKAGGRPVKYIEDRMEYLLAGGSQSWDRYYDAALAVKADGTVTGLSRAAARRPGRERRGLWHDLGGEAAGGVHRLLPHRGGAVRREGGEHQPRAVLPVPRLRTAAAQLRARIADGHRRARSRPRHRGDPPAQLHPPRAVPLHHPERQRVRQRQLRGGARQGARDGRLPAPARGAGASARRGSALSASVWPAPSSRAFSTGTPTPPSACPASACPRACRCRSTSSARSPRAWASTCRARASTRSRATAGRLLRRGDGGGARGVRRHRQRAAALRARRQPPRRGDHRRDPRGLPDITHEAVPRGSGAAAGRRRSRSN